MAPPFCHALTASVGLQVVLLRQPEISIFPSSQVTPLQRFVASNLRHLPGAQTQLPPPGAHRGAEGTLQLQGTGAAVAADAFVVALGPLGAAGLEFLRRQRFPDVHLATGTWAAWEGQGLDPWNGEGMSVSHGGDYW